MPLTLEELHDIRADCFADDIDIDHKRMAPWTSQQARDFFENGGVQSPSRASPPTVGSIRPVLSSHARATSAQAE